jgi:hypothetical protein
MKTYHETKKDEVGELVAMQAAKANQTPHDSGL